MHIPVLISLGAGRRGALKGQRVALLFDLVSIDCILRELRQVMLRQNQLNWSLRTDGTNLYGPLLYIAQRVAVVDRDTNEKYIGLLILHLSIDFQLIGSARIMYLQP